MLGCASAALHGLLHVVQAAADAIEGGQLPASIRRDSPLADGLPELAFGLRELLLLLRHARQDQVRLRGIVLCHLRGLLAGLVQSAAHDRGRFGVVLRQIKPRLNARWVKLHRALELTLRLAGRSRRGQRIRVGRFLRRIRAPATDGSKRRSGRRATARSPYFTASSQRSIA